MEYISVEQAAKELGVHVQTIRRFIKAGALPAFRLPGKGNRYQVRQSDLAKLKEPVPVPVEVGGAPGPVGPGAVEPKRKSRRK